MNAGTSKQRRIVVELESGEPISGTLERGGESRRFQGWLELLTALEQAHGGGRPRSDAVERAHGSAQPHPDEDEGGSRRPEPEPGA